MRCVRLLNGFKVGPKALLVRTRFVWSPCQVKVDPKTEDLLNEYRKKKEKVGEEGTLGATSDEIDQSTQRDDETVKTSLENIIKENKAMLEDEGLISFTRFHFLGAAKKQDLHMEGPRHLVSYL